MKFASFLVDGERTYGIVDGGEIRRVSASFAGKYPTLKSAVTAGSLHQAADSAGGPGIPLGEIRLLPPITDPGKILCVGMNYMAHIREMGREPPQYPALFVRHADSLAGHGARVIRPSVSKAFDYEGELAVVIGRTARYVPEDDALSHVAGYACFMDGSIRDFQMQTSQFTAGKNFPDSGAFGPWLVTADEIPDPNVMKLETRISGEVLQRGDIGDLCNGIASLIEYLSTVTRLSPGDVIATGTPSGVGYAREPQRWLVPGDVVEVDIDRIGILQNPVADEAPRDE